MRISDWSSDVCSSDLAATRAATIGVRVNDGPQGTVTVRAANGWAGSTPLDVTLLPGTNRLKIEVRDGDVRLKALHLAAEGRRSEEHTSELQSLMRISYAVFCLKKKNHRHTSVNKVTKSNRDESKREQHE